MLRFVVFDKARQRKGWVQVAGPGNPSLIGARAVARHNALSSAEFTVDDDHHLVEALATPGARCVVEYRPQGVQWMRLFSGPVRARKGEGHPATRTFTVGDDKALLWNLLGWPKPSAPIGSQTDAYWRSSGAAETVLKALVGANAGRYGHPVTVAPDQGRGGPVKVSVRMQPLADVLFPKVDQAGLGVTVLQAEDGSGLVVDVYAKRVHTTALSDRAGVIRGQDTAYNDTNPTVSRVIVGAGGEGEARHFAEYVDTVRESEWGETIEVFRDARDIKASLTEEPDRDALMQARADETLTEGAPTAALNLELAETEHFRFGNAVLLGDIVKASVAGGPVLTDTVREVEITQDGDGVNVTPRVGDRASDPDNPDAQLARAVSAALKGVRHLNTGR